MKKKLLTLAFLLGTGISGFSQSNLVKDGILKDIDKTRIFEKSKYENSCINTYRTGGFIVKEYDFNSNSIPDASASFEIINENDKSLITKDYAEMVLIDYDEKQGTSTKYEIMYADDNLDGILEVKENCY